MALYKLFFWLFFFNFQRLFVQVGGGQYDDPSFAIGRVTDAKQDMPKVAELLPELFEIKNGGYYVNASMEYNGQRINGVIPNCFELLLADHLAWVDLLRKNSGFDFISSSISFIF